MHDHHVHLFAAAAALASADCGPPAVRDAAGLAAALAAAAPDAAGWVRGVNYHESVAGPLDRWVLDRLRADAPVRVQHRSGQLWMLSSRAIAALGLDDGADAPGVERDAAGRATGRLVRADAWLRARLAPTAPPSLAALGRRLAALGITGVTDATPGNGPAELAAFAAAQARGELPPRVIVMGTLALSDAPAPPPGIEIGPVKLHLADAELPGPDALAEQVRAAHARGRAVAIHCVTRAELVLALAALEAAGARPGDRLEHVHVAPPECVAWIARLGLTVCVQPALAAARRADWEREADPADRPWLAPIDALRAAGVPLLVGSDAPYGPLGAHGP